MGSKALLQSESALDEQLREGVGSPSAALKNAARRRLMGDIADALEVPLATLCTPSDAVMPARAADADGAPDPDFDRGGEVLLQAYRRIQNPKTRQRLLALVQEAAEHV